MPKFAANLTMLFNEVDFLDRFEAAAHAGFEGVEYLFPYDYDADALVERLQAHGLTQVLHNLPAGDWNAGERGIACHPDRVSEFRDGVGAAIEYATALGCKQVNCLAGIVPEKHICGEGPRDLRGESQVRRSRARRGRNPPGYRAYKHDRHPRLLPESHLPGTGQ